jgi:hypothetical protein
MYTEVWWGEIPCATTIANMEKETKLSPKLYDGYYGSAFAG